MEIGEWASLNYMIESLEKVRGRLPAGADAHVKLEGDQDFGFRVAVTYYRDLTADEIALEVKYRRGVR